MEGILRCLRLRTATVLAALLAAAAVMMAVSGSASANLLAKDITLRVVNNTTYSATVRICLGRPEQGGDVSSLYEQGFRADPCNRTPFVFNLAANGGRVPEGPWPHTSVPILGNPIGVVVSIHGFFPSDAILYFYAKNPSVGLPFFQSSSAAVGLNGQSKTSLVGGELSSTSLVVGALSVRFHREGDTLYKVMTIELCGPSCTS